MSSEARLERKCKEAVRAAGGVFIKLVPAVEVGLPDRLVLLPGGVVWFVELKAPGGRLGPKQGFWERRLRKLGMNYLRTSGFEEFVQAVLQNGSG